MQGHLEQVEEETVQLSFDPKMEIGLLSEVVLCAFFPQDVHMLFVFALQGSQFSCHVCYVVKQQLFLKLCSYREGWDLQNLTVPLSICVRMAISCFH